MSDPELDTVFMTAASKLCGCSHCSGDATMGDDCVVQTLLDGMKVAVDHVTATLEADLVATDKEGGGGRNRISGLQRAIAITKKIEI